MGMWVGRNRKARRCYGFDEIALVPGEVTINPNEVDISWEIRGKKYDTPIIAAAMDGVVDTRFAIEFGKLGGIAVMNLEGIQTRYENPDEIYDRISNAANDVATKLVQSIYLEPIKEELISVRIKEIKKAGVPAIVSAIPQKAYKYGKIAQNAGADIFIVQSTVTTVKHISKEYESVDFEKLCNDLSIPVIVGNCVTYKTTLELMGTGIAAVLIGIGPGAACTTRGVLGIGVPQVTATCDAAAARDEYFKRTARYVPIITDGGMNTGGDICKAIACGADAVMVGSAFAKAKEAPGRGFHWGMATPHANLPRGTRIRVGTTGTLKQILYGPAELDDGSQNLIGALRTSMGNCGASNIKEMQQTELIIAPAMKTEGKIFQQSQRVGMGK
ncbi:MAG: inosine 5-monophosphate dehydrogenase [Candidatus Schekmanbacteria bacterium RIFCSPHIGHO2_02_FULL_38_11]|uniref:Inosine 5-monophosphate dehydrogenase n=1 Tax=Candidatus Schekmanbacteria bacterium RIFCSPLOWO2_12_FULL_38_15 TaxID=1817883 RepID=A0A1F7SLB2_9BACT|nr:MAG: inosine 5-monophosphate dehydrogenase [Candidatus Schekmanbacteria bacterium GWA2_38_9]OGL47956.1 MAG: inosine 5-monophosphate dehydrogenase [Candidatus Schekmanbacteria bacterium RIFCSPLOWO2_02_FULL_38_14]OGL49027.1 MAG: inosine 5-monophosphate dehydrogenase [Candidatus Schekmanbacteria bacterium RIFCSPHIGHO2_02_FULL_38_11]OGL54559.1 MAG: inosine 5-monophosphate dehydrogenase [Candidatus Schekmanbacteria bacterium RIFCSPLOWO2_12_FULL_38_15]